MRIGEYQTLQVVRESQQGFYLADADDAAVLLPRRQCPRNLQIGDKLQVFVLTDSEDRPIATTKKPYAKVGQFARMRVVTVTPAGAFLDWGLDKDLFCPIREQQIPMREGADYLVRVYLDEASNRVACTSKLAKYLRADGEGLQSGQPVKIIVSARGPDLISVIIDHRVKGSIFPDEWHEQLEVGDEREAYVKSIRPEDGKVAISLRPQGYQAVLGERERLLAELKSSGGILPVSDRSSPEEIQRRFGLSKGSFKKLLGALYREGKIEIDTHCIRLKA